MNRVILVGKVNGAERKTTNSGYELLKCEVRTEDEYPTRDGEAKVRVEVFDVVAWGNLARLRGKLAPGTTVSVEGRMQAKNYNNDDGDKYEVIASDIQVLAQPAKAERVEPEPPPEPTPDDFQDDDISF